jgi:metal-responsive CopG/Arc/MetJ family transcriptional regulator
MTKPKAKVSVTLSADLLALIDRDVRRRKDTRSGVIEQWLRRAATASIAQEIEAATAAYYQSLRDNERTEDEAISRALSKAAKRVSYGAAPSPGRSRGAKA